MSVARNNYPKYYDVDDKPVRVDYDAKTGKLFAINWDGSFRMSNITQLDGDEITETTYKDAVLVYKKYLVDKSIYEKEFKQKISELFGTQFPDAP